MRLFDPLQRHLCPSLHPRTSLPYDKMMKQKHVWLVFWRYCLRISFGTHTVLMSYITASLHIPSDSLFTNPMTGRYISWSCRKCFQISPALIPAELAPVATTQEVRWTERFGEEQNALFLPGIEPQIHKYISRKLNK